MEYMEARVTVTGPDGMNTMDATRALYRKLHKGTETAGVTFDLTYAFPKTAYLNLHIKHLTQTTLAMLRSATPDTCVVRNWFPMEIVPYNHGEGVFVIVPPKDEDHDPLPPDLDAVLVYARTLGHEVVVRFSLDGGTDPELRAYDLAEPPQLGNAG